MRVTHWLVAALAVLPLVTACGVEVISGTPGVVTNGLENRTAVEVRQAAIDTLTTDGSVHVTGTVVDEPGQPIQFDIRAQGASYTGTVSLRGATMAITIIGDTGYFRTDAAGWTALGVPEAASLLADKWVKGPVDMLGPEERFTIDTLVTSMRLDELRPEVAQSTLGDEKVVVVTYRGGEKLYVANTGTARPLRISSMGVDRLDFSEHGADFHIAAPPDAIDATQP